MQEMRVILPRILRCQTPSYLVGRDPGDDDVESVGASLVADILLVGHVRLGSTVLASSRRIGKDLGEDGVDVVAAGRLVLGDIVVEDRLVRVANLDHLYMANLVVATVRSDPCSAM